MSQFLQGCRLCCEEGQNRIYEAEEGIHADRLNKCEASLSSKFYVTLNKWNVWAWLDSIAVPLFTNSETAAVTLWERVQNQWKLNATQVFW